MPKIQLSDFATSENTQTTNSIQEVGPGKKTVLAVGHEYFTINDKPVVSVRFVCLQDHDHADDEGNVLTDTFFLNDKAIWRIARYALATGWKEAFDPEIEEELMQVMMAGPVTVSVKLEQNGQYTNRRVTRYDPSVIKISDDQKSLVESAESHWAGYLSWRSKNPRPGQRSMSAGKSQKQDQYDDIPF